MQILSFIRSKKIVLIIIILLLVVQAIGMVILPEYISKIVDIGIQKYGIENSVPIIIRKSEMDNLLLFISKEINVLENFELINTNMIKNIETIDNRNINVNEDVYVLKNANISENLNYEFARAITLLQIINKDESVINLREKVATNIGEDIKKYVGGNDNVLNVLKNTSDKNLEIINDVIDEKLSVVTEDILSQIASEYLVEEYKYFGITNTQSEYLTKTIIQMLLISFIICVSYIVSSYIIIRFSAELSQYIRKNIFKQIINMKEQEQKLSVTSLINRTAFDVEIIEMNIQPMLQLLVYIPIIFIGSLIKIRKLSTGFEFSLIVVRNSNFNNRNYSI